MLVIRVIFMGVIGAFLGLLAGAAFSEVFSPAGGEEVMGPMFMMILAGAGAGGIVGAVAGVKMK